MACTDIAVDYFHHVPQAANASTRFQSLYELQQLGQLCDVLLETSSGHCVSAHRVVLAASSPYFRAMFVGSMLESTQKKISLSNFDHDTLQALVMHAYNADFSLPADKVSLLMVAADFFQILPLHTECSSFIQQHLSPGNCLSIKIFAQQYGFSSLFDAATKFACGHFESVIACDMEHFLSIP